MAATALIGPILRAIGPQILKGLATEKGLSAAVNIGQTYASFKQGRAITKMHEQQNAQQHGTLAGTLGATGSAAPAILGDMRKSFKASMPTLKDLMGPTAPWKIFKKVTGAVAGLPGKLVQWGDALAKSQEHLKIYSLDLAEAFAHRDISKIHRDMASARRTGGTTKAMMKETEKLKDNLQPLADSLTNVTNVFVTKLTSMANTAFKKLDYLANLSGVKDIWKNIEKFLKIKGNDEKARPFYSMLARLGTELQNEEAMGPKHGRPD